MTNQSVIMGARSEADLDVKRRRILDAAKGLLIRGGFQDIVLDDVARQAGVAKGTLFLYYASKEQLFTAVFADLVEQLGRALDGLAGSGLKGTPLLARTVRAILAHFEKNRDFMAYFGAGRFPALGERSCRELMGLMERNMKRVMRILRLSSRGGQGSFRVTEYAAAALFGLCRSALMHKMITGHQRPLPLKTAQILDLFLHGVRGGR